MSDRASSRYPQSQVSVRSTNPLAVVAAVRAELRRAGAGAHDISRFTAQALERPDLPNILAVAERWVGSVEAR